MKTYYQQPSNSYPQKDLFILLTLYSKIKSINSYPHIHSYSNNNKIIYK